MCPSEHAEAVSSFSWCRGNSWTSGEAVLSPLLDLKPGIKAWPKPGNARITSPAPAPRGKDSTFAGVCWNKPRTCSEEHKITALPAAHSFPFCVKCLEILPCPDKKSHLFGSKPWPQFHALPQNCCNFGPTNLIFLALIPSKATGTWILSHHSDSSLIFPELQFIRASQTNQQIKKPHKKAQNR